MFSILETFWAKKWKKYKEIKEQREIFVFISWYLVKIFFNTIVQVQVLIFHPLEKMFFC